MRAIALLGLLILCAAPCAYPDADISVTQHDNEDPVALGVPLTYAILITNTGPNAATNVVLTDTLPANAPFVSISAPEDWTCTAPPANTSGSLNCSNASVAAGQSTAFTVTVKPTAIGVTTNTVTITTQEPDPNLQNNSQVEETTVIAAPQPPGI
jgi:uncharacterized repeat protein (TIGR01451 family)